MSLHTRHGMRLAAAGDPVGEEEAVASAQEVVDQRQSHDAEQRRLTQVLVEDSLERVFDVFAANRKKDDVS